MKENEIFEQLKKYKKIKEEEIPQINGDKIFEKIEDRIFKPQKVGLFQKLKVMGVVVCLIAVFIFLFLMREKRQELNMSELRSEIIIQNKNIKILWVQKKNFNLKSFRIKGGKK